MSKTTVLLVTPAKRKEDFPTQNSERERGRMGVGVKSNK